MKNKKYLNTFLATTVVASMVVPTNVLAATATTNPFKDIEKSYAKNDIVYLYSKGIVGGVTKDKFAPFDTMNRESFAALLGKTLKLKDKTGGSPFTDVSPWAQGIVGALSDKGIVGGYTPTKFGAKDPVTREQMAVMFVRALGYEDQAKKLNLPLEFKDADKVVDVYKPIVAFANKIGFLGGYPDGTFQPKKTAARQDVAALAYRYLDPVNTDSGKPNKYMEAASKLINVQEVESVEAVSDVTVNQGGTYTLPAKVKVTYKDKTTGDVAVTWDQSKVDVSKVGAYTATGTVGLTGKTVTAKVNVIGAAVAVTKQTVKDANTVTLELSREVTPEEAVQFVYNDKALEADKIVINKNVVTLTVPTLQDEEMFTLVIKDKTGNIFYSGAGKYDANIVTKIETEAMGQNYQVGKTAKVTFIVKDEDGDPVANEPIRIQVIDPSNGTNKVLKEQVLNSDDKGVVSYEYTSLDSRRDYINAIAVNRPATVRNEGNVTIDWSLAATGLVSVDSPQDTKLGAGTSRTYVATFKDDAGKPLPKDSKVYVYLGEDASATTKVTGDFAKASAGTDNQYAEATINNFTGTATLNVADAKGKVIKPMFYYDKDKDNKTYKVEQNDPRIQAGSVTYVEQIATVTLTEKKTGKVSVGDTRVVELKAIDQFGNDFLGTVSVGLEEAMDNLNSTAFGSILYDIDVDRDGKGDKPGIGEYANRSGMVNINFGSLVGSGFATKSVVNLNIKGGADKDKATLAAFVNEGGTNSYNPSDKNNLKLPVEFQDVHITKVVVTGDASLAEGSVGNYTVSFLDQNGTAMPLQASRNSELAFQILDESGKVVSSYKAPANKLTLEDNVDSVKDQTADYAEGTGNGDTLSYKATADKDQFALQFTSDTPGKYKIRAFLDDKAPTADHIKQDDEAFGEFEVTVAGAVLTGGKVSVPKEYSTNTKTENIVYSLTDQDGKSFVTKDDVNVVYTVANKGEVDLNVVDKDNRVYRVNVGETKSFDEVMEKNQGTYTLKATPITAGNAKVEVTAKVENKEKTVSSGTLNWVKVDKDASASTNEMYTGTVIAMGQDSDTTGWYVLQTSVGNILLSYDGNADQFTVDNNTDDKGKAFIGQLSYGDLVTWTQSAAIGGEKHQLQNSK